MNKKNLIFMIFLLFIGSNAYAVATCSLSSSGGALDVILQDFYAPTSGWKNYLYPIALKLYWFWFTAELLYQITFKKVLANDVNKLWYFIMIRTFTGYMFATIFVDPAFYTGVINYFVKIGSAAGGFTVSPDSGNPFSSLSPSSVMSTGSCMWDSAWEAIKAANLGITDMKVIMLTAFPIILMTFAVYILAAIMAFTLFMTALEAYIVMNAGVILCGFAGSSWTMGFWNKYLSYVGGIAIRLFVMCLILGLIKVQLTSQLSDMATASANMQGSIDPLVVILGSTLKLLISMLIFTFLVVKVPAMAGSMLTGTVNSGLGDVIQGASMLLAGAGLAAGLSKMGINLGGGGSGGGAKEAFKDTLRGNGGGGLPSGGGSSSSDAMRTASQTAQTATSSAEKAQGIAELSKDLKGTSTANSPNGQSSKSQNNDSSGASQANSSQANSSQANSSQANSSQANSSQAARSTDGPQKATAGDNNSGGGISGNDKSASGANNSANSTPNNSSTASQNDNSKPSKAMQEMIKNKDSLIKNFDKMATNSHSGAAEININPHRE